MSQQKPIALIGAPNSGKTTLYNWLTGNRSKTVNYPGATVEYSLGQLDQRWNKDFLVMDTPGTYSLFPKSADEEVTEKALYEHPQYGAIEKVILVVDCTQLKRHLVLVQQLKAAGFSFVIALTMKDLLERKNIPLDAKKLSQVLNVPIVPIDGRHGLGVRELIQTLENMPAQLGKKIPPWSEQDYRQVHAQIQEVLNQVLSSAQKDMLKVVEKTQRLDRLLLHPFWGAILFFGIMTALFSSIFWMASPFMEAVNLGTDHLVSFVADLGPQQLWADFLANGILKPFCAIFVFVPQIFILFLGVRLLESSGYLARAASIIDRPFSQLGMSGRSFVPLLSGFACSVPALMATRNISSKRDRWITGFIIPLMTCSARLPVYALLLAFLFKDGPAWKAGLGLAFLYIGSMFVGASAASILNKILPKERHSFFMMELPIYRRPQVKVILRQSFSRTVSYIRKAGPVIFLFGALIWAGTTFPHYSNENSAQKLESSYLGQVGQKMEPLFRPMGVDWRAGVGLLSAFAAREVFVSSLAVMYNIDTQDESQRDESLLGAMQQAKFEDGTFIFTFASVMALAVYFMIALQCLSTFAMTIREMGSARFAWTQLISLNLVAYAAAVLTFQILSRFSF